MAVPLKHLHYIIAIHEVPHCIAKHYSVFSLSFILILVKVIYDFVLFPCILT